MTYRLSTSPFDDIDELSQKVLKPLWTIKDFTNEEMVHRWCMDAVDVCEDYYADYFQIQRDNLLVYKGVQWLAQERNLNRQLDRQQILQRRSPRVVINHIYDYVEQWVSRLTRYRPAVAVYPASSNYEDKNDAKIAKGVLDHIWYNNNIDKQLQFWIRNVKVFGEAYMWVLWNPQKGDIHPDWAYAAKQGMRVPVLDSQGQPVVDETTGDPYLVQRCVRIGDVEYVHDAPWHVCDMPCRNREEIDWSYRWYTQDVEYLKAKYPDKADRIKADGTANVFKNERLKISKMKNEVVVYELYHRQHEFLDQGRYIKFIRSNGVVLENTILPYSHGKIPYVYMADIDVPDQIRGMSFIQQIFPITHQINAVASLIYKALVLFAHPKIVAQENSVDISQLLNESTVVFYSGGVPPSLMTQHPVTPELFNYLNKLEELADKISGIFTMSRGTAPSGVRAAKALRVLEEQEDKRSYITAIKYNEQGIVGNAKMTLATAGDYYDDTDGRLLRIVGRDNEYSIRPFKNSNLSKAYDIRIENTTALSQSPAARIEEISEINQIPVAPDSVFSKGQIVNALDLTASEEFKNVASRAFRCAESENQDLLAGVPVAEPYPAEDLITHWQTHAQVFQSRDYKASVPPQLKQAFEAHFLATEYLIWNKAYGLVTPLGQALSMPNATFQMKLQALCPDFPLLFKQPIPPMALGGVMPPGGMATPNTQMAMGNELQPEPLQSGADTGLPPPSVNPSGVNPNV